jgi:6-phosphofructokinase 1
VRIGLLTGGGDCPGLNPAIRAVVKYAHIQGIEVVGIYDSLQGLLERPMRTKTLHLADVTDLLSRGGTVLGTYNKGSPFLQDREKKLTRLREGMQELKLDGLINIGGEGSQGISAELHKEKFKIIGIPKTIDNDLPGTDQTIGFATCVDIVSEAVERLQSTAESHDRIMVLEVMGRDSGYIALHGGLAGGANVILIPEIPFDYDAIIKKIQARKNMSRKFSVIVVSEGASEKGQNASYKEELTGQHNLGGIGQLVAKRLFEKTGMDIRVTVLGHLQRGGKPNAIDRILATRFGSYAVDLLSKNKFGRLVVLKGQEISDIGLDGLPLYQRRKILPNDEILRTAENISICLGR